MNQSPEVKTRTEIRDGMRITWHQPIGMDDGLVLRADVYRPIEDGRYPVILSYGVYAKGLAYQDGYPMQWEKMVAELHGPELSPRDRRPLPVHRVGGDAAMEQREGGHARDLLLRQQPVARR